ncbi:hypothetical protein [Schumannella sp. 10F1B-5-1]|uniref:hypothetical protein n=1 Tax=Schumannella sp. 10F1B-5-1 TaxID=2590780 RepID=UPI0011300DBD|nr:hypothetical protein [Schumannella sp. 10F1B-5-1]TPW71596.1 hypothetical protein FJ658_09555 [Schumannella sp. 10F1B-5-1]
MKRTTAAEPTPRQVIRALEERLPRGWEIRTWTSSRSAADLTLVVTAPDGSRGWIAIETRGTVERRSLDQITRALQRAVESEPLPTAGLLVARYLSAPLRAELEDRRISYLDLTGNVRMELATPGLFLSDRGADSDPTRGAGRPRNTLKGEPAARIVRALLDSSRSWRIKDLVTASGASVGATYRAVEYLESQGLVTERDESKTFRVTKWTSLLRAWSADYDTFAVNRVTRWIHPRGIQAVLDRAASAELSSRYAFTGSVAAAQWAPFAPTRAALAYSEAPDETSEAWGLRPAPEGTANVLLIEPSVPDGIALVGTSLAAPGFIVAAPAQVAADLLNGPGRNPSEGEALIAWMDDNEESWRL